MSRIKTLVLAAAAMAVMAPAHAADFPSYSKANPPPVAPYHNWTGLYIGANGGYGVSNNPMSIAAANNNAALLMQTGVVPGNLNTHASGGFGGLQVGYNWQVTPMWVLGVEVDGQFGNIKGSDSRFVSLTPLGLPVSLTTVGQTEVDWWMTARGRAGISFDRALIYATGGLAWANVNSGHSISLAAPAPFGTQAVGNSSGIKIGYVVGAGIEYEIIRNLSVKAEALWMDLDPAGHSSSARVANVPFNFTANNDLQMAVFRAGANWRLPY